MFYLNSNLLCFLCCWPWFDSEFCLYFQSVGLQQYYSSQQEVVVWAGLSAKTVSPPTLQFDINPIHAIASTFTALCRTFTLDNLITISILKKNTCEFVLSCANWLLRGRHVYCIRSITGYKRFIVIISDIEFQLKPKHFVKNLLRLKKSTYFWWFLHSDRLNMGAAILQFKW